MAVISFGSAGGGATAPADLRVTRLRCEYLVDPVGLDVTGPRLSWALESAARGQMQTAYQVLVAGSEADLGADRGGLWDSGKVDGDRSVHVVYGGAALRSGQRCYWKVRAWDKEGRPSAYSKPAVWEMGLIRPSDWQARWISLPPAPVPRAATLDGCSWVWFPEGNPAVSAPQGTRYFRKSLVLPPDRKIASARLVLTADDSWVLFAGGKRVGGSRERGGSWNLVTEIDMAEYLAAGGNLLAISATNASVGPAGLIGKLSVTFDTGEPLTVRIDDTWKVSDREQAGWQKGDFDDSAWPAAKVIAGLGEGPWGQPRSVTPMSPSPFFRKAFRAEKPVRRARLYATALGVYEPHLNGRRVGDAVLAPGWTDYSKRVPYQTYDVTGLIRQGENVLGAVLGDGWYSGYVGFGNRRNQYGPHPRLIAQLHVEYADGSGEMVATDGGWKAVTGPIRQADLQMGESYDARAEMPGWDAPGFADAQWQAVTVEERGAVPLVAQNCEPVLVTEELKPRAITEPTPGVYIFDLGQNMVGWVRLKVRGAAGTEVRLRFAEMLNPDGTLYTTNLRGAKQADTYLLNGEGDEVWEPRFTFHGFRYVEVTGYPGKPTLDAITGRVAHSATPLAGRMETSSPLVNQLLQNIDWGQRGNFLSIPTDCPQRDERLGWTGDAQIFVRTSTYNRDVGAFFTKWLQDLEDAQSPAGAFPDVAPRQSYVGEGTAAWGDAGVICPWTIYERYGDTRILEQRYDSMCRWISYLQANSTALLRPETGSGDWLSIPADTPRDVLATAYFARSTQLLARTARVLGKGDDARKYEALWGEIKTAFNKAYVAPDGRVKGNTQTCYVLALHFDLLPQDKRAAAARYLAEDIEAKGGHLSTGFVGVGYLCPVLTETGYVDLAYRLLLNETFPSWGYSIKHGATTIWERWDGWTEEKGFQDPGMNSFNHYSLGSVGEWLYSTVAGIDTDPEQPGYKHSHIHPRPGGKLTHVKATYESIHGPIATDWGLENDRFTLNVTVPANTTATVHVRARGKDAVTEGDKPAETAEGVKFLRFEDGYAVYAVGSGSYAFRAAVR